ncbi:hypothetical protein GCM10027174_21000 [Salinifilum aidingensis]
MSGDEKPSWEEVEKLLNNPDVSDEKKYELVRGYEHHGEGGDTKELVAYRDRYRDEDEYTTYAGAPHNQHYQAHRYDLDEAYKDAKEQADSAAEEREREVENARGALEDSERAAQSGENGGAGVKTADELLESGKPGLKFFENWVPLYHDIKNAVNDKEKVKKLEKIKEEYQQQSGLDFAKFAGCADDLEAADKGAREAHQKMAGKLGQLWGAWSGQAAQASEGFFQEKFTPTAQERVAARAKDGAESIREANKSVAEFVRNKVKTVLGFAEHASQIDGKGKSDWKITIEVANNSQDDDTLKRACAIWNVQIDNECWGNDLTDEQRRKIQTDCQSVVRDTFASIVESSCAELHEACKDAKEKIDETFGELNKVLGEAEEDPFKNPGPAPDSEGDESGGPQKPDRAPGGGGAPSGGAPGGGPPGGGAPGGQDVPKPSDPQEAMPGTPAGPGGPGMPGTPEGPGSSTGPGAPGGTREEVTLGQGEQAVSLSEPAPDGTVEVEVTGADGEPKTYALALGQEGDAPAGPGQMPGQQTAGQPLPGQQAPGEQMSVPGDPGQSDAPGGPGSVSGPGAPGGPGAPSDGPIPVQPGEDGKAVIEEGDRTITVERTPEGRLAVSVDNGGGQPPLHQTVGFGGDDGVPAPGMPDGPAQSADPGTGPGGQTPPAPPEPEAPSPEPPGASSQVPTAPQTAEAPAAAQQGPVGDPAATPGGPEAAPGPAAATGAPEGQSGAAPQNAPASTTPQSTLGSVFSASVGGSVGSIAGDLFGGSGPDSAAGPAEPGFGGDSNRGASAVNEGASGPPGGAQSGGPGGGSSGSAQGSGAAGGGMMGGGMGMMGGGMGQQGGDQERSNDSPWRTEGQLFDDGIPQSNVRYRSVIGEDEKQSDQRKNT